MSRRSYAPQKWQVSPTKNALENHPNQKRKSWIKIFGDEWRLIPDLGHYQMNYELQRKKIPNEGFQDLYMAQSWNPIMKAQTPGSTCKGKPSDDSSRSLQNQRKAYVSPIWWKNTRTGEPSNPRKSHIHPHPDLLVESPNLANCQLWCWLGYDFEGVQDRRSLSYFSSHPIVSIRIGRLY